MSASKYNLLNIEIPDEIASNWQDTVNIMSELINVPAALIMCVHEKTIEVFLKSDNESNVYTQGEMANLDTGLYCETVMDTQQMLLVPNALEDENWKNNPDVSLDMISYLGMPLLWPNKKVFGTICVLDSKTNNYSNLQIRLLTQFRNIVEANLENIYTTKQMQLQADFQKTLFQNSPVPVFYKDLSGRYMDVNKAWENMTGIEIKNVLGKTVFDISPKELASKYAKEDEKVLSLSENPQIYESKVKNRNDGQEYDVVFYKSAYFDEEKNVKGLIGTILDVSKVAELELKLKDQKKILIQSKMAALGEMIGNIAHQWRQPLSLIVTTASGVLLHKEMDVLTEEMLITSIEKINETAQRMSKTIESFNNFITQNNNEKIEFSLSKEIKKSINIESGILEENNIKIIKDFDDSLIIKNSPHALLQVFFNMINNAKDILVDNQDEEHRLLFISTFENKDEVIITIKDNGGGIDEKLIDKVFEPYFTTKHRFEGTGLGLSISYHIIVDVMDGFLSVENEEYSYEGNAYKGAKFIITLSKKY